MKTLKPAGWIISNDAAIISVGATLAAAIADYNRDVGGVPVTLEDGTRDFVPMTEENLGGHIARPATAALLAQVEDVGGAISWEVVHGVACTCDEAAPPMRQIATGLSEAGRRVLAEFLAVHLSDKALAHMVAAYEADITFDINDSSAGHLEVSGMHTCDGNPAVRIFDGDDVILEDVEVEEEGDAHLTASTDGDWRVVSDGDMAIRVDFTNREFAVEYRVLGLDDDDPRSQWTATPFQGAEFGLDAEGAWRRVAAWVENS